MGQQFIPTFSSVRLIPKFSITNLTRFGETMKINTNLIIIILLSMLWLHRRLCIRAKVLRWFTGVAWDRPGSDCKHLLPMWRLLPWSWSPSCPAIVQWIIYKWSTLGYSPWLSLQLHYLNSKSVQCSGMCLLCCILLLTHPWTLSWQWLMRWLVIDHWIPWIFLWLHLHLKGMSVRLQTMQMFVNNYDIMLLSIAQHCSAFSCPNSPNSL